MAAKEMGEVRQTRARKPSGRAKAGARSEPGEAVEAQTARIVDDLMSTPPHSVRAGATANDAARLMWECDVGVVPIVDQDDRVVGVVTDRDLAMAAYLQGLRLGEIPVERVMSSEVRSVRPNDPVQRAAGIMARHQVRRVLVTDSHGALVGVLSLNDLAGASADPRGAGISEHDVAQTLRAVCAPRSLSGHLGHEVPSEA